MIEFALLSLSNDHQEHETIYQKIQYDFPEELKLQFADTDPDNLQTFQKDPHLAIIMIDTIDPTLLDVIERQFPLVQVLLVDATPDGPLPASIDARKIDAYLHSGVLPKQLYFTIQGLLNTYRHKLKLELLAEEKKNRVAKMSEERRKMQEDCHGQINIRIHENQTLKKELLASKKELLGYQGVTKEREKLKRTNQQLYEQIKILSGQISVKNILKIEIERSRRKQRELSLLTIGIDKFGDMEEESKEEARGVESRFKMLLSSNLRITDFVSHISHGRYHVILTETDGEGARKFVERFNAHVLSTCTAPNDAKLMVSYGFTAFAESDTVEEMMKRAENALLKAQANGKSNIVCLPA